MLSGVSLADAPFVPYSGGHTTRNRTMPTQRRTAGQRWKQFLSFVAVWVLTAVVGSALLIYFTASSEPELAPEPANDEPQLALAPSVAEAPGPEDIETDADLVPVAATPEPLPVAPPEPVPNGNQARDVVRPRSQPSATRPGLTEAERAAKVGNFVRDAARATEAGDYDRATRAYESALELDPNNFEIKILMSQVASLTEIEAREAGAPRFRESPTNVSGGPGTGAAAAELIVELLPAAPNPGDPYILRVRAYNSSEQSLALTSVELVESHDSMKSEKARTSEPLARQLGPNENALLWERKADWTRADRTGTILVAVTLADGTRLSKSVQW